MDSYPDASFWDNTPAFTQLPDSDFFALLQKQFPHTVDTLPPGVNPQNISSYSLPSLSPPSDDSSPSPPNSNHEVPNDDLIELALKRKASDEDLPDFPNQKTQHTTSSLPSDKKLNGTSARRKSGGHAPKDENRLMKRKEQNRAAQRAFRERKEKHVKDLEDKVADLEAKNEQAQNENENLRDLLTRLRNENIALKQSSFTFTAPKNPIKSPVTAELPKFSLVSSPSASASASPEAAASSKTTNPLDWSSLTSFDPAMLNLLDDPVPQPTATEGAMQLDFGFGRNTGLASYAPYTTIASNPMFMSFASTFDSLSPDQPNSSTPASNTFLSGPFNFDMNSMSAWSPAPTTSQDAQLDDLFTGYLNPTDFSISSQSSASVSPASHRGASPLGPGTSQTSSSSKPSPDDPLQVPERDPFNSKTACKKLITSGDPSPFATGVLHRGAETPILPCAEGAVFPKTIKSDKNIEVLTAWKSITSDPKFKDVDISSLCAEFSSKARCDGTQVVLEPQGVHSILETLSKNQ